MRVISGDFSAFASTQQGQDLFHRGPVRMKNDKNPLYADNGIPMKSSMSAPPAPPPPPKGMLGIYPPQAEEESEYYSDEEWNGEAWMDEADV